jgi:hypothetical protein
MITLHLNRKFSTTYYFYVEPLNVVWENTQEVWMWTPCGQKTTTSQITFLHPQLHVVIDRSTGEKGQCPLILSGLLQNQQRESIPFSR